jgi:transketolase
MELKGLEKIAARVRLDIATMLCQAGSGHPGGAFSAADFMTALYFGELRHDPKRPDWAERDMVIFSKGHACPVLYACLAEAGYFPKEELLTLRQLGSRLQGHPGKDKGLPGLEISSGSLGQGLSVGVGVALAHRYLKKDSRVYVIIGDGECDCGQIWEAAMAAGHYKLDNLCGIVDYNKLQIDGSNEEVMGLEPFVKKWQDFRWEVLEIDGHNMKEIVSAYKRARTIKGKPSLIMARTIKGKGVSFMEGQASWHGDVPKGEKADICLKDLKKRLEVLDEDEN